MLDSFLMSTCCGSAAFRVLSARNGADGGDACYVRFMSRVRLALGQFYGSIRFALGPR